MIRQHSCWTNAQKDPTMRVLQYASNNKLSTKVAIIKNGKEGIKELVLLCNLKIEMRAINYDITITKLRLVLVPPCLSIPMSDEQVR